MPTFETTSDYLERIVDPELPILIVEPGIRVHGNIEPLYLPNDVALIWFAERLADKSGRLDIVGLPKITIDRNVNELVLLEKYMKDLSQRANLGKIKFYEGDIGVLKFPFEDYGLIWDHGALQSRTRDHKMITNYHDILKRNHNILFAHDKDQTIDPPQNLMMDFTPVSIQKDQYKTNLTQNQIFKGISDPNQDTYREGYLFPKVQYQRIDQFEKLISRRKPTSS